MSRRPPDRSPPFYRSEQSFQSLPQIRIVLPYPPDRTLTDILHAVMELTRFGREEAMHRMWDAYHNGQTVLTTTYLERAECLAEQFAARGLPVVLERA